MAGTVVGVDRIAIVFSQPLHIGSALVTEPALVVSQILLIVVTIAAFFAMRAEHRLASGPAKLASDKGWKGATKL
jgi:hypothetical protein